MPITTDQQLSLYNGALRECKSRKLASLTENREPRYLLDDVWADNVVGFCLEDGLWTFAARDVAISNDPDYAPDFGYQYRFTLPPDFVRTASVCADEYFEDPITRYTEQGGYIFCDLNTIFVKYISNDPGYGTNYLAWPQSFVLFVERVMAWRIIGKLSGSTENEADVEKKMNKAGMDARSKTAMEQPTKFPPLGMFARARYGQWGRGRRGTGN